MNRVLVVEDDPLMKSVLTRILYGIDEKVDIAWAVTAEEGEAILKDGDVQLVIADYLLEGELNGLDLWKVCQARYPNTKFILISGLLPELVEDALRRQSIPPPHFLSKPLTPSTCRSALQPLLQS